MSVLLGFYLEKCNILHEVADALEVQWRPDVLVQLCL
jgi:hypothetical protein